jgi:hypothetical protein
MKSLPSRFGLVFTSAMLLSATAFAQTDGVAHLNVTLNDYNGSGASHWTVAWVTTESGSFIKTLRKQGTKYAFSSSQWTTHCPQWNAARGGTAGSTVVDGYTSATATSYAGTNSPVILAWNCRDTNNVVVPDGRYKFWVQYAEDSGAGPHTTNGLLWVKGPLGMTNSYPNLSPNFTGMQVAWVPSIPASVAPTITSAPLPGTGTVGVPFTYPCAATGTAPITFTASGLPPGLVLSSAGALSGFPTQPGRFVGTLRASNGTPPDASQPFDLTIGSIPVIFAPPMLAGQTLVLSGTGPAGGRYAVLTSPDPASGGLGVPVFTNTFDPAGRFNFTNIVDANTPGQYLRLRIP